MAANFKLLTTKDIVESKKLMLKSCGKDTVNCA